jgi:hypothetical protein
MNWWECRASGQLSEITKLSALLVDIVKILEDEGSRESYDVWGVKKGF